MVGDILLIRLLAIFLLGSFQVSLGAVYQYVDENGNVVFSDVPREGSFERKLSDPAVIKFKQKTEAKKNESVPQVVEPEEPLDYSKLEIISPKEDAALRENSGNVSVSLSIEPKLQTNFGHYLKISIDGRVLPDKYQTDHLVLNNLDRGSHNIIAKLYNESGRLLKQSSSIKFHLHRFSARFR